MARTPEAAVKAAVKAKLTAAGAWFCMPIGTGYGNSGVPDFVCCLAGRFVAIETKAPGKRRNTTVMQDKQIVGIHKAGGVAMVIDNADQLDEFLTRQGATQ